MSAAERLLDEIHPSIWRASQLARGAGRTVETGYASLSAELPGGGWPVGALIELLLQNSGIGEYRLLQPALFSLGKRPIALVQPPHPVNGPGLASMGLPVASIVHVKAPKLADGLWASEQILRTGSFGALMLWLSHVPQASLRRLHLAAQSSETLFIVVRPMTTAQDASPAVLRLALRPRTDGLAVDILKRRGPVAAEPLCVTLQPGPVLYSARRRAPRPVLVPVGVLAGEVAVET